MQITRHMCNIIMVRLTLTFSACQDHSYPWLRDQFAFALRPDKSILLGLHYLKQHFRMPTWPSSPQSWLRFLWRRYFQKTCNGEKESFKQYRIMPPVTNPKASNNRSELEKNYHLWQIHKLSTNQELKEFNYITINITFYKKMAGHCAFRS